MEELSVQEVVSIDSDGQVESDNEQDEEQPFAAASIIALEAQEHLQRLARYCSCIERLNMHVHTLKDIGIQIHRHQDI